MLSAENTISINRPLHEVFAFVADKENDPRWRHNVKEMQRVSGDGTVGTRYHQVITGPRGDMEADIEITGYEPGRRVTFRTMAGPIQPEGSVDLIDEAGGTRLTFKLWAELSGAKKLMAPKAAKSMKSEVNDSLDRLKQILETG
jgi:uncharacterized protein YndB with AHSA1/START domain